MAGKKFTLSRCFLMLVPCIQKDVLPWSLGGELWPSAGGDNQRIVAFGFVVQEDWCMPASGPRSAISEVYFRH